jgi:succinyl-CoA:mesaconate CoA transferase
MLIPSWNICRRGHDEQASTADGCKRLELVEDTQMVSTPPDGGNRQRTGPLTDVRVIDLTLYMAGPFATMLMTDMGADVLKVEPPGGGYTRDSDPQLTEDNAYGGYFQSINRGKRSIVIDLKSERGKQALKDLVAEADVLVENFRVGTMERLGLSYETLKEVNPELIYASIRGFGDPRGGESPYAKRPSFDLIAQAMGGVMSITGTKESGPVKVGPGVGDIFPASLAVNGILGALHHRTRTGEGQYVDVGMVDGMVSLAERIIHQYQYDETIAGVQGASHPIFFPFDRFEAEDGYFVIAAPTDSQWEDLCAHLDRPDLVADYPSQQSRSDNSDTLHPIINEWTKQYTQDELFEELKDDVPCGPVYDAKDICEDEHFQARNMLPELEHADTGQKRAVAGTPIKLTETEARVQGRAPFLGEHSRAELSAIGYSDEEIERLFDENVVYSELE